MRIRYENLKDLGLFLIALCLSADGFAFGGRPIVFMENQGIYIITNPEGERYVGQSRDLKSRIRSYSRKNKARTKIEKSINEHGFSNHKIEIIETCGSRELNYLEKKYIKELAPELNSTKGGSKISDKQFRGTSQSKHPVKRLRFNEKAQELFGHKKVAGVSYQRIFDALVEAEWNRMHKKRVGCCPFMKKGGDGYIIASETYDVHL